MNDLSSTQATEGQPRTWKAVYTIVERAGANKKFWVRIGTAFVNRDQSINVRLDASPTNGQLQIRDAEPYDPSGRRRFGGEDAAGLGGVQ
jgi:hypothetical protein